MKQKFSRKWIKSKQPRKQRKYRANAPLHIRHKFMSVTLSKELRKKYERRSFSIRKGDTVKIMRGKFRKKTGKIGGVDLIKLRVNIEGIQRQKKDGTKVNVYFDPSVVQIQELKLDDKKRERALKRKSEKKEQKQEEKKPEKENASEKK